MSIKHWINGRQVDSKDRFVTYNPATGEAIAEVAAGRPRSTRPWRRRRGLSQVGQHARQGARPPDAPAGRADRSERAHAGRAGNARHRPADLADAQAADSARLGELQFLRRSLHPHERPHLSGRRPDAELHAVPAGGRVRVGLAVERALHDRHLEDGAVPGAGQHGGAEDVGAVAADRRPARHAGVGGRHSARRAERGAGLWRRCGRCAGASPGVRAISFTGGTVTGKKILASAGGIEILDGAGRQVAGAGVRRRRRRARAGRGAVHHLLAQRRALHRGLAHLRAGNHLRRFRAPLRRAREPAGGGRPDRRAYPCRFDDHAPALGKRSLATSVWPRKRAPACWRAVRTARRPAGAAGWRQFRASHGAGRRGQPHALRPGRDLRPGRLPAALQGRGRRPDAGQRCEVRTGVPHLDPRYRPRASAGARHRGRHGVHQHQNVRDLRQPSAAPNRARAGKAANTATRYSPRSRTSAFPWAAITSRAGACRPSFVSPQHKTRTRRQTPWASSRWRPR